MAKITDIFGRLFGKAPAREHRDRVASTGPRDWADLGSVLGSVTPATLRSIFSEADEGLIGRQIELAQTIRERDEHLASVDQTRRLAVCGLDWTIEPGDPDDERSVNAADAFREVWTQHGEDLVSRMMDAVLEQWHIEEIVWDSDGRLGGKRFWWPASIEEVDGRKLCWPYNYGDDPAEAVAPRIQRNWSISDTIELTPGKFLTHSYSAIRGRPGRGSLIRCIAALWMFKRFSLIDLASLIEQWGRPWPCLKYASSATPEQVQAWIESLADSMADRVLAVPIGSELEVKPAGAVGADTPHINLIELCNRGMSKVMVGSTTIAEAAGESRNVSSPTHAAVREDIRNADAKAIGESVHSGLAVPFTLWNFGENVTPPKIRPNLAPKPDPSSRADLYVKASTLGLRVKSKQVYSDLSIEAPDDVEEIIILGQQGSGFGVQGSGEERKDGKTEGPTGASAPLTAEDLRFYRDVFTRFLADRTVSDMIYNATDMADLYEKVKLKMEEGYEMPWSVVRDDAGAVVSGRVIKDEEGDVIGGAPVPGSEPTMPGVGGPGGMPQRVEEKVEGDKPADEQTKETNDEGRNQNDESNQKPE